MCIWISNIISYNYLVCMDNQAEIQLQRRFKHLKGENKLFFHKNVQQYNTLYFPHARELSEM